MYLAHHDLRINLHHHHHYCCYYHYYNHYCYYLSQLLCCAGRNNISAFDNVMYLRQFKKLRLVNLAGNPIAVLPDYRSYVLSHIKDLTYLDYRRVNAADVASAIEQHQVQRPAALWYM